MTCVRKKIFFYPQRVGKSNLIELNILVSVSVIKIKNVEFRLNDQNVIKSKLFNYIQKNCNGTFSCEAIKLRNFFLHIFLDRGLKLLVKSLKLVADRRYC